MKNKGFIATSLIYSFFIAFTLLMTYTINRAVQSTSLSQKYSENIKSNALRDVQNELFIDHIKSLVSSYSSSSTNLIDLGSKEDYAPVRTYVYNEDKEEPVSIDYATSCTNTLAYDGTADNNLRYVGYNPCNFVKFNNEIWRVIGIMNNVDNGSGTKETRIKLVRNETIGRITFNSKCIRMTATTTTCHYNYWPESELQKGLNEDYLNINLHENTHWNENPLFAAVGIYNYRYGLKTKAQSQIDNAVWYVRGSSTQYKKASEFYTLEREAKRAKTDADWTGKVALIYPSDYGFAAGGEKRADCLNSTTLGHYDSNNCVNFLRRADTIILDSMRASSIFHTYSTDGLGIGDAKGVSGPKPSVYLKNTVAYLDGDGSYNNPFIID